MKKRILAVIMAALFLAFACTAAACAKKLTVDEVAGNYQIKKFNGQTLKEFMLDIYKKQGLSDDLAKQGIAMICSQLGCTEEQFYNDGVIFELNKDGTTKFSGYFIKAMEMMGQSSTFPGNMTWKIEGEKIVFSNGNKSHETEYKNNGFVLKSENYTMEFSKK